VLCTIVVHYDMHTHTHVREQFLQLTVVGGIVLGFFGTATYRMLLKRRHSDGFVVVSATSAGHTVSVARLTSGFDFQHGISYECSIQPNHSPKMHCRIGHDIVTDGQTDRRTDCSIT